MRCGAPVGEVSAPRSSGWEHLWSVNQTVWFSLATGASESASETTKRWKGLQHWSQDLNSRLHLPTKQGRSPHHPDPTLSLSHHLAFAHTEPASWDAHPPMTKQTHFYFQYPSGALPPSRGARPEHHSSTQTLFLSLSPLHNFILHSLIQQIILKEAVLKAVGLMNPVHS